MRKPDPAKIKITTTTNLFFDGEIQIGTHTEATLPVYICADRSKQTPKKPQS